MAKKTVIVQRRKTRRSPRDILTLITAQLSRLLNNPIALLLVIVAIAVYISVTANATDNLITKFADRLSTIEQLKPLATWIKSNVTKFAGLVIYSPAVVASGRYQSVLAIVSVVLALYVPESNLIEYVIQSLAAYLLFTSRSRNVKIAIFIFVLFCYFAGFGFTSVLGKPPTPSG